MTEKNDSLGTLDRIIEGTTNFSFRRVTDEVERRIRRKVKKASRRIAATATGLFMFMMAIAFISMSVVRYLSTTMSPALSWGIVGVVLALVGMILVLTGRLIT